MAINAGKNFVSGALNGKFNASCFAAGTMIETADGDHTIEEIQIGDLVLSANPETGEIAYKPVVNTYVHVTDTVLYLTIDEEIIETTEDHPFWVEGQGWTSAKLLQPGDVVRLKDGSTQCVDNIEIVELPEGEYVAVYNFEVADFHTYFVSDFDAASLAFDIVSFCIEPTPMGAVDILTDVVGLVTPGVPSAGLKVGVHAAETAYDAYKAVDTVHDLSKAADVAITVSKKGDAVLDAADAAKDIRNADYLQDSLNRIVKAQHPNPKKGFSNTYALTTSKDGRLVLSKNRGVPGPKARQEAENIFGKGKVEFAGGKNANLDLDLLKSKGISTKGIDFGRLHHAEPRAVQYMLKNNIPTDNAVQVVSRKSCDSCSNLQYNLGWKRRR